MDTRIQKAYDNIKKGYRDKILLADLAAGVKLSPYFFQSCTTNHMRNLIGLVMYHKSVLNHAFDLFFRLRMHDNCYATNSYFPRPRIICVERFIKNANSIGRNGQEIKPVLNEKMI